MFKIFMASVISISFLVLSSNFHICIAKDNPFNEKEVDFEKLMKDLESPDDGVKTEALIRLKNLKDKRAVPALIKLLDADAFVRVRAAEALGEIRDGTAIAPLINRFIYECSNPNLIWESTGEPLSQIPVGYVTADSYIRRQFAIALRKIDGAEVISRLKPLLNSENENLKYETAVILGELKVRESIPVLIKALEEYKNGAIRSFAAETLGDLGDSTAVPALKQALKDNFKHPKKGYFIVRNNAARALEKLGVQVENKGSGEYIVK